MHISEGVVSTPVLAAGALVCLAGLTLGLKRADYESLPRVALLSAVFFVASLIHVPVGPVSAHLILNGLLGMLLGWAAFPAVFVGLALQAVLFQFGGLMVLGLNTATMAGSAVICHYLFTPLTRSSNKSLGTAGAFAAGFCAVLLAAFFTALALRLSGDDFAGTAKALFLAHLPIMFIEGLITAVAVGFLRQVNPRMLGDWSAKPSVAR